MGPKLSIVIATYNRASRLRRCVEHVRRTVRQPYEIVIVAGGRFDVHAGWLVDTGDVRLLVEHERRGCCRAYDTGFRLARGEFVTWLNDDSFPLPGAIDAAVQQLERADMHDVGMAALYHTHQQPWNELHGVDLPFESAWAETAPTRSEGRSAPPLTRFGVLHVRSWPYANFGLLRRSLLEALGYLDTDYYYCAWDPDLAMKVQRDAGLKVLGCPGALVFHEEHIDDRKADDVGDVRTRDNERLFAKWKMPAKGLFVDPRPGYRLLLEERGLLRDVAATAISSGPAGRSAATVQSH